MRNRFPNTNEFIEIKKRLARVALEGGNAAFVARKNDYSPKTLNKWVHEYRDEVEEEMEQNKHDRIRVAIVA
ncbi:hypothetical protein BEP19_14580 [Ammoniphilus oxalaticus]|uniref:Transposase n=1 Tax=Ammoniphilus oxalaticus TaxID=66863 RepID=A0A419SF35_9BACL|nr:transposase [Ammoniphilus oxalaticus]RKD21834.1 hypothetical protein BEP19_14580 [Ammoniphilus oxalaticus]